jgi:hypothetical protein
MKQKFVPILMLVFLLTSIHEAKAWRLFGRDSRTISGMECVEAADGGSHGHYVESASYFFGIRISKWSGADYVHDGDGGCN